MGANSRTSTRRTRTRERMTQALRLRATGATYSEIAEHLKISPQAVYNLVRNALDEFPAEAAGDLRQIELMRLDRLTVAIWTDATAGSLKAIDRVLRLMERRAKLTGLDAPAQVEDVSDWTDEELNEYATTGRRPASRRGRTGTPAPGTIEPGAAAAGETMAGPGSVTE